MLKIFETSTLHVNTTNTEWLYVPESIEDFLEMGPRTVSGILPDNLGELAYMK